MNDVTIAEGYYAGLPKPEDRNHLCSLNFHGVVYMWVVEVFCECIFGFRVVLYAVRGQHDPNPLLPEIWLKCHIFKGNREDLHRKGGEIPREDSW